MKAIDAQNKEDMGKYERQRRMNSEFIFQNSKSTMECFLSFFFSFIPAFPHFLAYLFLLDLPFSLFLSIHLPSSSSSFFLVIPFSSSFPPFLKLFFGVLSFFNQFSPYGCSDFFQSVFTLFPFDFFTVGCLI